MQHDVRPTLYYCNPNIYPQEEYERRKQECTRYARTLGLDIVDADYDHPAWLCAVQGLENEPERGSRCLACFRYRLLQSARYALTHGFPVLTTTLASSRWKSLEQVDAAGAWAGEQALDEARSAAQAAHDATASAPAAIPSLTWWGRNWRKGGLQERRNALIKEWGFYNQTWCGCEFSLR